MNNMSARAKGYRSRKRRRSYGQAHKDRRFKAIEIFRPVEKEDSDRIQAIVRLFFADTDESEKPTARKINGRHRIPLLSPQLVREQAARGVMGGFNVHRTLQEVQAEAVKDERLEVGIVGVDVVGIPNNRRALALQVSAEQTHIEQRAIYHTLGQAGIRGFNAKIPLQPTRIMIATTEEHIPTQNELTKLLEKGKDISQYPMDTKELRTDLASVFQEAKLHVITLGPPTLRLG